MRVLIQRVKWARVTVAGQETGSIGPGYLLLVGFGCEDFGKPNMVIEPMIQKILNLRIMNDSKDRMNRSLLDTGGDILAVSQFTLHADCRRGRRPGFANAIPLEDAEVLFGRFVDLLGDAGVVGKTGLFGANMEVSLLNDGPVTIWLDSVDLFNR